MNRRRMMMGGYSMEDLMKAHLMDEMTEYSNNDVTSCIPYGFSYQKNLRTVNLPNCTLLDNGSFYGCENLSNIYFPKLKQIYNNCFRNCKSLTEFITNSNFDSRLDQSTFEGCNNLVKADFYHINNLGISSYALACNNLVTLIIRNEDFVPTGNGYMFGGASTKMNTGEGKIYVPSSMVESYKTDSIWSKWASQIFSIDEL